MQSYLLDTHVLLWYFSGSEKLAKKYIKEIESPASTCFISIASIWEIAIKIDLGKLQLGVPLEEFGNLLNDFNINVLPIGFAHILELSKLENIHRDPFDRIIISQCLHENLTLLTNDKEIKRYNALKVI